METNEKIEETRDNIKARVDQREILGRHYYGDSIRNTFVWIGIIMLIMTPILKNKIPVPSYISISAIILLAILAGFINPKSRAIIIFDFLASVASLSVFGYMSIKTYQNGMSDLFFLTNFALSIFSFFALYWSSKTLRGNLTYKA